MGTQQIGFTPATQDANRLVDTSRPSLDNRLVNSKKVVTASEHFDLNQAFFEKHGAAILQLVQDTAAMNEAIKTLENAGQDAGTCKITVPGRFYGTNQVERSVAEINDEIRSNLDQEVVQTALKTLGIVEQPKPSFFSTLAVERPSNKSIAVGTTAVAAIGVGSAIYFDKVPTQVTDFVNTNIRPHLPTLPSQQDVIDYVSDSTVGKFVSAQVTNLKDTDAYKAVAGKLSAFAATDAGKFILDHKYEIGAGVVAAAVVAGVIYKVAQSRKNQEEAQKA